MIRQSHYQQGSLVFINIVYIDINNRGKVHSREGGRERGGERERERKREKENERTSESERERERARKSHVLTCADRNCFEACADEALLIHTHMVSH